MLGLPEVAVGSVVAALVAGIVSLLGLIISKEQKTSEFRQAWIDGLRSEISLLIAHMNVIFAARQLGESSWAALRVDAIAINQATAQIKLRLNPREEKSRNLLQHIADLENFLHSPQGMRFEKLNELEEQLAEDAQALLKAEWDRVRKGEVTFRVAKISAAALVLCLAVFLPCYALLGDQIRSPLPARVIRSANSAPQQAAPGKRILASPVTH